MAQRCLPRTGRILLVEDCDDMRRGLAELLQLNGYAVRDTANGEQAMRALVTEPEAFALVLLDLLLPGVISGHELRARQLAHPRLAGVPMVVVSAYDRDERSQARLKAEAWLEKPFRGEQLLSVVRRYVTPSS